MWRRACSVVHGTICRDGLDPASVSARTCANLPGQLPSRPLSVPAGPLAARCGLGAPCGPLVTLGGLGGAVRAGW